MCRALRSDQVRPTKRRVLSSVALLQLLYAAQVWHKVLKTQKLKQKLTRVQKIVAIRMCSAYRTLSVEGTRVLRPEQKARVVWIFGYEEGG